MTVSGHKSESSIRSYARTGVQIKENMSSILSAPLEYEDALLPIAELESLFEQDFAISNHFDMGLEFSQVVPSSNAVTPVSVAGLDGTFLASLVGNASNGVQFHNCVFNITILHSNNINHTGF